MADAPGNRHPPGSRHPPGGRPAPGSRHRGARAVIRTHEAGTLRPADTGATVTLAGWVARRRDHGGVIFVDLRDGSGVCQVVFREDMDAAHALRNEFCVKITGAV